MVALAAGALVWSAASELPLAARLLTAILLGPAPVAFMMQASAASALPSPLPRMPIYIGSMAALWLLGLLSFGASVLSNINAAELGLVWVPLRTLLGWTVAAAFTAAALVIAFRQAGMRETPIMHEMLPVTNREKLMFCGLSVSAGVCEELAFRGFLLTTITIASGSVAAGVVLSSLAFGILHAHQNVAGSARAALLGAILCVPLLVTGSIFASMITHTLIDVVGGLWLGKWLLK